MRYIWIFMVMFMVMEAFGDGRIIRIGESGNGCRRIGVGDIHTLRGSGRGLSIEESFGKKRVDFVERHKKLVEVNKK